MNMHARYSLTLSIVCIILVCGVHSITHTASLIPPAEYAMAGSATAPATSSDDNNETIRSSVLPALAIAEEDEPIITSPPHTIVMHGESIEPEYSAQQKQESAKRADEFKKWQSLRILMQELDYSPTEVNHIETEFNSIPAAERLAWLSKKHKDLMQDFQRDQLSQLNALSKPILDLAIAIAKNKQHAETQRALVRLASSITTTASHNNLPNHIVEVSTFGVEHFDTPEQFAQWTSLLAQLTALPIVKNIQWQAINTLMHDISYDSQKIKYMHDEYKHTSRTERSTWLSKTYKNLMVLESRLNQLDSLSRPILDIAAAIAKNKQHINTQKALAKLVSNIHKITGSNLKSDLPKYIAEVPLFTLADFDTPEQFAQWTNLSAQLTALTTF